MANENTFTSLFDSLEDRITNLIKTKMDLQEKVKDIEGKSQTTEKVVFKDMIAILDAFSNAKTLVSEKGWDVSEDAKKACARFLTVEKQLRNKLENHGITEINVQPGDMVDDNLCTTVDTDPDPSKENGIIISVEKKGYMLRDLILRPAEVIIVKN